MKTETRNRLLGGYFKNSAYDEYYNEMHGGTGSTTSDIELEEGAKKKYNLVDPDPNAPKYILKKKKNT